MMFLQATVNYAMFDCRLMESMFSTPAVASVVRQLVCLPRLRPEGMENVMHDMIIPGLQRSGCWNEGTAKLMVHALTYFLQRVGTESVSIWKQGPYVASAPIESANAKGNRLAGRAHASFSKFYRKYKTHLKLFIEKCNDSYSINIDTISTLQTLLKHRSRRILI